MHSLTTRFRHRSTEDAENQGNLHHPKFSHATWGAVAVGVIGAGTSLYGANKQAKSQAATNAANQASVEKADQAAWVNYLLQRGLAVDPNTPTGSVPTTGRAVNTKLPLWMDLSIQGRPAPAGTSLVRRRQPVA